jgi:methylthioribose-1-phosphate isomerase
LRTIELRGNSVVFVDQTELPRRVKLVRCKSAEELARAIKRMQVRGAPVLAAAAAMALAITALRSRAKTKARLMRQLKRAADVVKRTRPTAVNLFVGLKRVMDVAQAAATVEQIRQGVVREARRIADEDVEVNERIGKHGAELLKDGDVVLTHCNAGALATVGYGTALGVIRSAWRMGKKIRVVATETRPLLQGARLTAWELKREGIPTTLVVDSAVGHLMARGEVTKVLVGADRIAANGDVANKIGTYTIAVLAKEHRVPFYVVAPIATIDLNTPTGNEIPIEYRAPHEVQLFQGRRIAPKGVKVLNPAFDVTPARLITGIVTERGVVKPSKLRSFLGT